MLNIKIKERREALNLTQAELAKFIGVSPSTIGMYEQGRREPDSKTLKLLVHNLKTSSDYLLGIKDNKKTENYETEEEILILINENNIKISDVKYLIELKNDLLKNFTTEHIENFKNIMNKTIKEYNKIINNNK
jgi:transcriptional regulator with XRE-family HTH domain